MSVKDQLLSIIVKNPDLDMKPGEICFFEANASIGTPHEEVTTTTKTKPGIGIGVRLTKHFGIGVGRQKVSTNVETNTVWDKDPCKFFVLDDRIVLKVNNQNVYIDYSTITDMKVNKDALTITTNSQKCYLFMAPKDVDRFVRVYGLIGQAGKEGLSLSSLFPASSGEPVQRASGASISDDYAKTVFLLCVGRKATPIMKRDEYPKYLFYDCNIQNAQKYHKEMLQQGYLMPAPPEELLATLKLPELKEILQNNGLSSSGKKADLISAIIENIPAEKLYTLFPEQKYVLSDVGRAFMEEHSDYVKLREHQIWQISPAEYDAAKGNSKCFYDVCWGILNKRIMSKDLFEHRNTYYNMYTLLKEEGKNTNALEMLLRVLYYDVNCLSSSYMNSYIQGYIKKREFLERAPEQIYFAPAIIKDIGDMEEYYSEDMIHRLYSNKDAFQPCSEKLFAEIVHSILKGNFDEDYYKQKLVMEFRRG